jgi:hypothetical protein
VNATAAASYIVAIPGTDKTRELSREALLTEMAKGVITPQFWVWMPDQQDWKQISEMPELRVPLKSAAVPAALPKATPIAPIVPVKIKANRKTVYRRSPKVEEDHGGFSLTKFIFGLLYVAVAAIIGLNYLLVDKPFDAALADSPYILVPAHAHLGSFVQPNALIIHILPNKEVTDRNFPDVLYTLAKGTPNQPFQEKPYEMVALTSAWFSQFAMRGSDWQQLGQMSSASSAERKNFITDHLGNIAGEPLIRHADQLSPSDLDAARTQVWQGLTQNFLSKS